MFSSILEISLNFAVWKVFFGGLIAFVLSLKFMKMFGEKENKTGEVMSRKVKKAKLCASNWIPEPLIEEKDRRHEISGNIINCKAGKYMYVNNIRCLNFATHNYLGLIENERIQEETIKSISKYGVGSCGPRGLYGTIDVHLDLEEKLAKFMNVQDAVIYSYGFSTISSAIAAYSKKTDIIFADEKVNFAIQRGIEASRSTVFYFKHNDPQDLENLLDLHIGVREKAVKKFSSARKFLVLEGIYANTGTLCMLPKLLQLAKKYKLRIFIDESISFGVIGKTGRGITEYFAIHIDDIDLIMVSMEYALVSVGGFCIGTSYIIEHQRLSGLGYCFSASLPPLLAVSAIVALNIIEENPKIISNLTVNCKKVHNMISSSDVLSYHFNLLSDSISPIKHLVLKRYATLSYSSQNKILNCVAQYCIQRGVIVTTASYLIHKEHSVSQASIRLTINSLLNKMELLQLVQLLEDAIVDVYSLLEKS